MQELQDDPYIQLPVDQSLLFDYNDVVFNNLDDYMNRKERFLKSPDVNKIIKINKIIYFE
jgi:hypothetical protein